MRRERPPADGSQGRRGLSSVIGVFLMVAVVLVLVSVTGTGLFVEFPLPDRETPLINFAFEYTDDGNQDTLVIRHSAGDRIPADQLSITIDDAVPSTADGTYTWAEIAASGQVAAGAEATLAVGTADGNSLDLDAATVQVLWTSPDGDTTTILDEWGGSGETVATSADNVSLVGGSPTGTGNTGGRHSFTYQISATDNVTVTGFAIETSGDVSDVTEIARTQPEVTITIGGTGNPDGEADTAGYGTDGTYYDLNTTVDIDGGQQADVNLGNFPYKITTTGATDPESADLTVTLMFADGSETRLYFDLAPK